MIKKGKNKKRLNKQHSKQERSTS